MRFVLPLLIILLSSSAGFAQTAPAPKSALVTVVPITEGVTSPTINITGSVYFALTSDVAAESSGKVAKVYVNEGDKIKEGQPLAALDDKLLSYTIATAIAETAQGKANLEKTARDYERNKSLYNQQAIAQLLYDNALTDYENAQSSYSSAIAKEAKLKTEKDKMVIRSPFSGVVTAKSVNVGEWVNAGGVVASVAAPSFEAKIYLPERVLKFIKQGDKIFVTAGAKEFQGTVLSINSKGDASTRTFLTRIELGADPELKEGIIATASIPAGAVTKTMLVKRDAVLTLNNEKGIFKVMDDTVQFIPVTIVANSGENLAIKPKGELKVGDKAVLNGNDKIKTGSKIKIVDGLTK